jgi:hypothetical protein
MFDLSQSSRRQLSQLGVAHPALMAHARLFVLLALLVPLFFGLHNLVLAGVPRVEIRFVPQDVAVPVSVPVEVPVERVVERIVYVPVERVEPAPGTATSQSPVDDIGVASPANEEPSVPSPEASEASAVEGAAGAPVVAVPGPGSVLTAASASAAPIAAASVEEPDESVEADSLAAPVVEAPAPVAAAASVGASLSVVSSEIHQAATGANRGPFVAAAPSYYVAPADVAPAEDEASLGAVDEQAVDEQPEGAVDEGVETAVTMLSPEDAAAAEAANIVATAGVEAVEAQPVGENGDVTATSQEAGAAEEAPTASTAGEQPGEDVAADVESPARPVFQEVAANLGQASVAAKLRPDLAANGTAASAPADSEDEAAAAEDEATAAEDEAAPGTERVATGGAVSSEDVDTSAPDDEPVAEDRGGSAPTLAANDSTVTTRWDGADDTVADDDQEAVASDDVRADAPALNESVTPVSNSSESLVVDPQS